MTKVNKKRLSQYIRKLYEEKLILYETEYSEDPLISFLTYDSRQVMKNTVFVCKGAHFQPSYLKEAVSKGAVCYISQVSYEEGNSIKAVIVKDIREAMAHIANLYYDNIWKKLSLIGITGTKGKSTTAYYIKSILDEHMALKGGEKAGILSSIENYDGVIFEESHLTTPETLELHNHFKNAVDKDIKYMVMEVSSQALKYDRTKGIVFNTGIFLNLSQDHISAVEHKDFKDYKEAKKVLFSQCETAIINKDSSYFKEMEKEAREGSKSVLSFSLKEDADYRAVDVKHTDSGYRFKVEGKNINREFSLNMKGLFNVENALAAISCCHLLGIKDTVIEAGLSKAKVPGRMEIFMDESKGVRIFVDYAHNRLSFQTLFDAIFTEYGKVPVSIVFGCPGNKALGRRKELGEISGQLADFVYITEEDSGEEDLSLISKEILSYAGKGKAKAIIIDSREDAIKKAIDEAPQGGIVLITGKGRETRQKRGILYEETLSDVQIVERILSNES